MRSDDVDADPGKLSVQLRDSVGHATRDGDRIRPRVFVNDQPDRRRAIKPRQGMRIRESERHRADVAQRETSANGAQWRVEDLGRRAELRQRAHGKAKLPFANRATGTGRVLRANRVGDVFRRQVEGAQSVGVKVNANFIFRRPDDGDTRNAFDLLQPPRVHFGHRACETAQVARVGRITLHRQHRNRSLARITRQQRRTFGPLGKSATRRVEPFAHGEHGAAHVGAPSEACRGGDFAIATDRPQLDQPRRGRDGLFNWLGDKSRHFRRRRTRVHRANCEHGERDIGQQRYRQPRERHGAEQHDRQYSGDRRDGATDCERCDRHSTVSRARYGRFAGARAPGAASRSD